MSTVEISEELLKKLDLLKEEYGSRKNWIIKKAVEYTLKHPVHVLGWSRKDGKK